MAKLKTFRLDEISAVDRPAQAHAKMVLMKRDGENGLPPLADFAKAFFAKDAANMSAKDFSETLDEADAARRRWAAYDALYPLFDALRESMGSIAADGTLSDAEKVTAIETSAGQFLGAVKERFPAVEAEVEEVAKALKQAGVDTMSTVPAEVKKQIDEAVAAAIAPITKRATDAEAALAKAQARLALTAPEQAFIIGKSEADADAFVALSKDARAAEIAKASDANPIVYTASDGEVFRKSDDSRLVKFARQADEDRKLRKEADERAQTTELTKRAEVELGHLPGAVADRVSVLKHLASAPEAVIKAADAMFKAAEAALAGAFVTKGATGGGADSDSDKALQKELDDATTVVMKRDNSTRSAAMEKALLENRPLAEKLHAARQAA